MIVLTKEATAPILVTMATEILATVTSAIETTASGANVVTTSTKKCFKLHAITAVINAKCLSNPQAKSQCTVVTASAKTVVVMTAKVAMTADQVVDLALAQS